MSTQIDGITRYDQAESAAGGQERPFSKVVRAGDFVFDLTEINRRLV